jgi:undecaprenyl-diphosphatase
MQLLEIIKAIILGIIQGITEWLPVSSTGHMILFDSFWPMDPTAYRGGQKFIDLF